MQANPTAFLEGAAPSPPLIANMDRPLMRSVSGGPASQVAVTVTQTAAGLRIKRSREAKPTEPAILSATTVQK